VAIHDVLEVSVESSPAFTQRLQ